MTRSNGKALASAALLALLQTAPALAQTASAGPSPAAATLDADAEAALNRMGAALRGMNSFEVRSDATSETVYDGTHKIMSRASTTYSVQMPDRMTVDMQTDTSHRRIYYNGKVMSVVGMKIGKYVTFPVSGTVSQVLERGSSDFGIDFPLQDLFRWGAPSSTVVRPTAGYRIGEALVNSRRAVQYAFTQPGVDFQVWLDENGTQALPVKMVITNTEVPAQPQFVANYEWNQAPTITADSFTFTPGPNDKLVDFGTAKAAMAQ